MRSACLGRQENVPSITPPLSVLSLPPLHPTIIRDNNQQTAEQEVEAVISCILE